MIVTRQKSLKKIMAMIEEEEALFLVGCGSCATLCKTGGEEELKEMREVLTSKGKEISGYLLIEEACHVPLAKKELKKFKDELKENSSLLIFACGAGVQAIQSLMPQKCVYPALDSLFIAKIENLRNFQEACSLCAECILDETAGICPLTRCAKGILNGPCGGMDEGKCEINREEDCAWVQIYQRLKERRRENLLQRIFPPKDFSKHQKPSKLSLKEIHGLFKKPPC